MTFVRFFFCAAALVASTAASAGCQFWHTISFADGTKGCLTDYRVADMSSRGWMGRSVARAIPHVGGYVVATPAVVAGRSCPAVVGLSVMDLSSTAAQASQAPVQTRILEAVNKCTAAVRNARGAPDCSCEAVLVDGATTLTPAQFAVATSTTPRQ